MSNLVIVGISDQQIVNPPDTLITYALGSCVGICLHDVVMKVAGLSHVLLPAAFKGDHNGEIYKYADTAIEALIRTMEKKGCHRNRITAKIAGGANMFITTGISIGERNVEMVKQELLRLKIKLLAEDTGLNYGRTVTFNPTDGSMTVKSVGRGIKVL